MKRLHVIVIAVLLAAIAASVLLSMSYFDAMLALRHDTNRWAVIRDGEGSQMAVEPVSDKTWEQLSQLCQNKSVRFVGGIVERYGNKWGFRFSPQNLTVAEVTAEGLQATIRYIGENLNYWLGGWAYVSSRVTETHSP